MAIVQKKYAQLTFWKGKKKALQKQMIKGDGTKGVLVIVH